MLAMSTSLGGPADCAADPAYDQRYGAAQPLDEATRPRSEDPAPAGGYSAHEVAQGMHLVEVHDHLRGELERLRDLVDQVARGLLEAGAARSLIATMTLRQNSWTLGAYCATYCRLLTAHHSIEDASMFPRLRAREPQLAPVLERLEHEHHVVADVLEQVDRALVHLVGAGVTPSADDVAPLRRAVDLLGDVLLSHLAYEEQQLLGPLARHGFF